MLTRCPQAHSPAITAARHSVGPERVGDSSKEGLDETLLIQIELEEHLIPALLERAEVVFVVRVIFLGESVEGANLLQDPRLDAGWKRVDARGHHHLSALEGSP